MPKIDVTKLERRGGSGYPGKHASEMDGRTSIQLTNAAGITQFGANITILQPGAKSSLRHWHEKQDEFMMVTQGVCTLVDDHGETVLNVGDCAAFPAGDANGHCVVNTSDAEARFLIVGTRTPNEVAWYSDIDMKVTVENGVYDFTRQDGSPYPGDEND